jgi:hypothetical protein
LARKWEEEGVGAVVASTALAAEECPVVVVDDEALHKVSQVDSNFNDKNRTPVLIPTICTPIIKMKIVLGSQTQRSPRSAKQACPSWPQLSSCHSICYCWGARSLFV